MNAFTDFHGPNSGYILELFERYQADPDAVDDATRRFFQNWSPPAEQSAPNSSLPVASTAPSSIPSIASQTGSVGNPDPQLVVGVANLAQQIRSIGHFDAQLDPLGTDPPSHPTLTLNAHGLTEEAMRALPASLVGGPVAERTETAWDAIQELRNIYSSSIGHDHNQLRIPEVRTWLQYAIESDWHGSGGVDMYGNVAAEIDEIQILERLTQVEGFELFLHSSFPGKTRFSIEGLDMMVPILDEIVSTCAEEGIQEILIGMAHRGRLNVLTHVLKKPYRQMLLEFKDSGNSRSRTQLSQLGWTGDVKYHAGADREVHTDGDGIVDMVVRLAPNPSHLEHVNPVVEGMARAAGTFVDEPGPPREDHFVSVPIQIHGDAAFAGQGIVAETLNFTRLNGYSTGGTIHIIANNQVGFTTLPNSSRSTIYASDMAKGFKLPIVHVNADDPVACIKVARMAIAYRNHFKRDFVIDLIGYRRYGHNEGDEPRFTQPQMYERVDALPTVRQLLANRLADDGRMTADESAKLLSNFTAHLQETLSSLSDDDAPAPEVARPDPGTARKVVTAVDAETLRALHADLNKTPDGFTIHPRLQRIRKRGANALETLDEPTVDWSTAEQLALASILAEGTAIRITGEDVKRGTFSHRHAVLFDSETGEPYVPLHNIPQAGAAFAIYNSPLTEAATIGFEYGYSIERPERLVIWEAQYGDFVNTAQAIIDEYVVSGLAKWNQTPALVLLLPYGFEGQGPDHSTGRLERFLQLAAETNMRIAHPTTAAQYFHLLRRQAKLLISDPLPLIVMTPKSLLRHPLSASTLTELSVDAPPQGRWQPVLDDAERAKSAVTRKKVKRLILCSGKVYVNLMASDARPKTPDIAIARVEQLYPFPADDLSDLFARYPNLKELVWVQEEPRNMGAWSAAKPQLNFITEQKLPLRYIGRPRRASPAEGSMAWHQANQAEIVKQAFEND